MDPASKASPAGWRNGGCPESAPTTPERTQEVTAPTAHEQRRARVSAQLRELAETEPTSSFRNDNSTPQGDLLVIADVAPGRLPDLYELLHEMAHPKDDGDLEVDGPIPFLRLRTVHFARVLVHPRPDDDDPRVRLGVNEPKIAAQLVFATDFDGSWEEHVDELVRVAEPGLARLFEHCVGWNAALGVRDFIERHRHTAQVSFVGHIGRSVGQIRREERLRVRIEEVLDHLQACANGPRDPLALARALRDWIRNELPWTVFTPAPLPRPPWWVRLLAPNAKTVPVVLLTVVMLLPWVAGLLLLGALVGGLIGVGTTAALGGLASWAVWRRLRQLEATDPVIIETAREAALGHAAALTEDEDEIAQNQMSSVIFVKQPLWLRRLFLHLVLRLLSLAGRKVFVQGRLGQIQTIHFARWALVDGGRRLLFFSNFDGSWESYLGEFVDRAAEGLTAVWSNCVGFPRAEKLRHKGASDEEGFKRYSRQSQVRTQVWYSAYKHLTVSNINQNSLIRLGLCRPMTRKNAEAWLALL